MPTPSQRYSEWRMENLRNLPADSQTKQIGMLQGPHPHSPPRDEHPRCDMDGQGEWIIRQRRG